MEPASDRTETSAPTQLQGFWQMKEDKIKEYVVAVDSVTYEADCNLKHILLFVNIFSQLKTDLAVWTPCLWCNVQMIIPEGNIEM